MTKIHFVSLFGVDLDYDILAHWCHHYLKMQYDSYTVFLHSVDQTSRRFAHVKHSLRVAGFTVRLAPEKPYTTAMRNTLLSEFAQSLNPLDYMVVADSDEFHRTGPWAGSFRELIESCDVLHGTLRDRWGSGLHAAQPATPLDIQYPYSGSLFEKIYTRCDSDKKDRWRKPNTRKILAARAGAPVAHLGSHVLYTSAGIAKQIHGCIVDHFKWRETFADRLRTKWYYQPSYEDEVLLFFQREAVAV